MMDVHSRNGYHEIIPPYIVNRESMTATGQLPKFEEDAFKLTENEWFLNPTAEVPTINLYRDEIIDFDLLPLNFCSYTMAFRSEAGSAGRDTRGLIRTHQFNKVELIKFSAPESSYDELEKMLKESELILQLLKIPYRVVALCTGDLGASMKNLRHRSLASRTENLPGDRQHKQCGRLSSPPRKHPPAPGEGRETRICPHLERFRPCGRKDLGCLWKITRRLMVASKYRKF